MHATNVLVRVCVVLCVSAGFLGTALATCSDATENGDETDVDCGGSTCDACADGQGCAVGSDCLSGVCGGGGTCDATREVVPPFSIVVPADAALDCGDDVSDLGVTGTASVSVGDFTISYGTGTDIRTAPGADVQGLQNSLLDIDTITGNYWEFSTANSGVPNWMNTLWRRTMVPGDLLQAGDSVTFSLEFKEIGTYTDSGGGGGRRDFDSWMGIMDGLGRALCIHQGGNGDMMPIWVDATLGAPDVWDWDNRNEGTKVSGWPADAACCASDAVHHFRIDVTHTVGQATMDVDVTDLQSGGAGTAYSMGTIDATGDGGAALDFSTGLTVWLGTAGQNAFGYDEEHKVESVEFTWGAGGSGFDASIEACEFPSMPTVSYADSGDDPAGCPATVTRKWTSEWSCSAMAAEQSITMSGAASCSDATENGDETDVDCGGSTCPACGVGNSCAVAGDCALGLVCATAGMEAGIGGPRCVAAEQAFVDIHVTADGADVGACDRGMVVVGAAEVVMDEASIDPAEVFLFASMTQSASPVTPSPVAARRDPAGSAADWVLNIIKTGVPSSDAGVLTLEARHGPSGALLGTRSWDVEPLCPRDDASLVESHALQLSATLEGLDGSDFDDSSDGTPSADRATALQETVAAAMGIAAGDVTNFVFADNEAGTGALLTMDVTAPRAVPTGDKQVSVTLDAARVAGASLSVQGLAFAALGRTVGRVGDLCCTVPFAADALRAAAPALEPWVDDDFTFAAGDTVTVSASTASAGASLYYTDDGSLPTSSSTAFPGGGVALTTTTTLRVVAVEAGVADSFVTQRTFNFV